MKTITVALPCVDLPELVINAVDAVIKHAGVDETKSQQVHSCSLLLLLQ